AGRGGGAGFEPVAEADEGEQAHGLAEVERQVDVVAEDAEGKDNDGETECGGGAQGHKGVHVGRAGPGGPERRAIERPADVNLNEHGQDGDNPVPGDRMALVAAHDGPVGDFDGQPGGKADDGAVAPGGGAAVLAGFQLGALGFDGFAFGNGASVVAAFADDLGQAVGIQAVAFDDRGAFGKADVGAFDA